ncbi:putative F420-0 ABC transporter substrate-binding protein [Georgenia alba]|uniref:F420-0 ABC transporter substrate-binding protein n=1 Tax=Georgenia alba TaxID=2233858 RepID=A0ABW2QBA9_9MICO
MPCRRTAPLALLTAVLLAGCGATAVDGPGTSSTASSTPEGSAAPSGEDSQTVSSCGVETTLETPPERVVTIKSSATEMVLALGAGDRLVGTAFSDGPLPEDLAGQAEDVPVLAEQNPSAEAVLELEPDLVYAGWESNLSSDGAGERSMFDDLGIATYVSPSACREADHQPERLTFDLVFEEITEVGRILGGDSVDAAERLVAEQRATLEDVRPTGEGRTALWYSSGNDVPYVGAGIGAPQMIMDAVGLQNVAEDVPDTWTSMGWEAVASADPDVIVLVDSAWNTAESKIEMLESNPVTRRLSAVQDGRYVVIPFPATEAGVRNVPAAADLSAQLAEVPQ